MNPVISCPPATSDLQKHTKQLAERNACAQKVEYFLMGAALFGLFAYAIAGMVLGGPSMSFQTQWILAASVVGGVVMPSIFLAAAIKTMRTYFLKQEECAVTKT